jgi:ABC-type uncharacterized transport system fused permease/ATPase subunit
LIFILYPRQVGRGGLVLIFAVLKLFVRTRFLRQSGREELAGQLLGRWLKRRRQFAIATLSTRSNSGLSN